MGKSLIHIIHRQIVELSTSNADEAREIQVRNQELLEQLKSPAFEACFDDLLSPDQHLIIERLEINLGSVSKKELYRTFGSQLGQALRNMLLENIAHGSEAMEGTAYDKERRPEVALRGRQGNPAAVKSILSGPFAILMFYLENGRLPGWVPMNHRMEEDWLHSLDQTQQETVRKLFQKSEQALIRLASQFSAPFIFKFLQPFKPEKSLFGHWQWVDLRLLPTEVDKATFKRHYWSYALSKYFIEALKQPFPVEEVARQILLKTLRKFPTNVLAALNAALARQPVPDSLRESLIQSLEVLLPEKQGGPGAHKINSRLRSLSPFKNFHHTENVNALPVLPSSETYARETKTGASGFREEVPGDEEAVWVPDAGLVILSPFLTEFFRSCGFLEGNDFISPEITARAVNLLAYLSQGEEEIPEPDKLLPKLFCGVLWKTVLPETMPVSETETAMAKELLMAVVKHWKALRNSSPEALREAFIRRPGKIFKGNTGMNLEVKRKTQDVLLDRLPWGFSTVKLPWMPEVLFVKWN